MILERKIPFLHIINNIKYGLIIVTALSVIVSLLSTFYAHLNVPISVGTLLGTAIALLLSFKLSQSYERWWEARKIWGAIVNDSRTLVLQLLKFTGNEERKLIERIANRQIAWCYCLGRSLRKLDPFQGMDKFVSDEEISSIRGKGNVPLSLIEQHNKDLKRLFTDGAISDFQQVQLDNTLLRLTESQGQAERIKNTVFPRTYRMTLQLSIYIFLITFSLSITELPTLVEIPLLIAVSLPFLLLEKIAFRIQDPFENRPTDTPMTNIATNIEINIKQMLDIKDVPEVEASKSFFVL